MFFVDGCGFVEGCEVVHGIGGCNFFCLDACDEFLECGVACGFVV